MAQRKAATAEVRRFGTPAEGDWKDVNVSASDDGWKDVPEGDWKDIPDSPAGTLPYKQETSRQQFEANKPESTIGTRSLTALEHSGLAKPAEALSDVFRGKGTGKAQEYLSGVGKGLYDTGKALLTNPAPVLGGMAKGTANAVVEPLPNYVHAIRSGDWDAAAGAAADIAFKTVPAIEGVAGGVKAGMEAVPQGTFRRTPVDVLKRVFPEVESQHLERAGHDLKNAEATVGPVTDIPSAMKAEEHAATELNKQVDSLITPQKDIMVPGSRKAFVDAQMEAIPKDLELHDPEKYKQVVQELQQQSQLPDFSIGELNDARKSANALRRTYYNSKLGAQLTKEEQLNSAMLGARDRAAHMTFENALNQVGLGGTAEVKSLTQRLGSLIKTKEAMQGKFNVAELEAGTPTAARFGRRMGNIKNQVMLKPSSFDTSPGVNQDIADAMRRWTGKPAQFQLQGAGAVAGKAPGGGSPAFRRPTNNPQPPAQGQLMPSGGPGVLAGPQAQPKPYAPGMAPMDDVVRRQRVGVAPTPPARPTGQLSMEQGMAPDLFGTQAQGQPYAGGSELSPEGYGAAQQQRQMWRSGAPAKAPGQIDLFQNEGFGMGPTPAGPAWTGVGPRKPSVLGINQTQFNWQPAARDTYTMADLNSMAREYADHLNKFGGGAQRSSLLKDLEDIQHEIDRRQQAQRAGVAH